MRFSLKIAARYLVAADNRVEKVIVPIRDGLTIIYKKPGYVSE